MFFSLIAVDGSNLSLRTLSRTASRVRCGSAWWICASPYLPCLVFSLCFLQVAAARAQSPPDPALTPAREFLQQGKLGEAEASTRSFLQAHADSTDAHFLLGFILFREVQAKWLEAGKGQSESLLYSGDASGSVAQFRDAKAKESLAEFTAGAKYHVPNAFDLKIVALDYILLKDNVDADHWLTRSLQADPRDPQAWYYLGRTKYSSGQFREAIEAFEECLKLEPRNVEAENNVGLSFEALDRPGEAIQAFENAIAWQAKSPAKNPEPFIRMYLKRTRS